MDVFGFFLNKENKFEDREDLIIHSYSNISCMVNVQGKVPYGAITPMVSQKPEKAACDKNFVDCH